jgi:hypothetical protein
MQPDATDLTVIFGVPEAGISGPKNPVSRTWLHVGCTKNPAEERRR